MSIFFVDVKSVILCGIESQACVLQTALDLMAKEYDVHVVADAVSSRSMVDRCVAWLVVFFLRTCLSENIHSRVNAQCWA